MSLLLNDDFTTYTLRHTHLVHNRHVGDGVSERLITLPSNLLNNAAFRAAGWVPDTSAVKRCYSPPIPTTGAAGGEGVYFRVPTRARGVSLEDNDGRPETEEGVGGMVTGRGSEDTIPAAVSIAANEKKRRQKSRREMLDDDDSSDLDSEESDDEEEEERSAAHGIRFAKMPVRDRSKSTPANPFGLEADGPALMVTSPSKPVDAVGLGLRRGSLGQVEAVKQRVRRDTTTSSEMSSDNEFLDASGFNRKLPGRPGGQRRVHLEARIQEEEKERDADDSERDERDEGVDSELEDSDVGEASDLSDEFEVETGTANSPLLGLGVAGAEAAGSDTSHGKSPPPVPPAVSALPSSNSLTRSPSKGATIAPVPPLPKLPPGRPFSALPVPSLISMALRGSSPGTSSEKPFQRFADLSGKGESSPLWIKIYAPFCTTPMKPLEVPIRRLKEGEKVQVTDLIGLSLWRYSEEDFSPALTGDDANVNRWTLRIVEDEEVDFDFPALVRTRPVTDFTSNNNRPPQRRARDKPWDEFGLVRATDAQLKENEAMTPSIETNATGTSTSTALPMPRAMDESENQPRRPAAQRTASDTSLTQPMSRSLTPAFPAPRNPITGPSFVSSALRKETGGTLLDLPQRDDPQSTPRTGAPKTVRIHFTDPNTLMSTMVDIETTADTYIAEIFTQGVRKLGLDKALYVLKVHGTQTVAPSDRTVEALGQNLALDLVRRRFIGAGAGDGVFGLGLSGSPGSSSPNAPLELDTITTPGGTSRKGRKGGTAIGGIYGGTSALANNSTLNLGLGLGLGLEAAGKRYNVLRKQPLSFAPSHPRTLIITPEYLQILPAAAPNTPGAFGAASQGKVTNVPMTNIVGVKVSHKHPKMVRVLVYKGAGAVGAGGVGAAAGQETKRYDFECETAAVAENVVADMRAALDALG